MQKSQKIPAFILATNKSGVFPSRSLLRLGDKSVLEIIKNRLSKSSRIGDIIVCTSTHREDNSLEKHAKKIKLKVIRGSLNDTLLRLIKAYNEAKTDTGFVIRGDTPFVDPVFCDKLYEVYHKNKAEFAYSEHLLGLPYGTGAEIINIKVLEKIMSLDISYPSIKTTTLIRLHEKEFKTVVLNFNTPMPDLKLVISNEKDYEFAKEVLALAGGDDIGVYDLIKLLKKHPLLLKINKMLEINEIGVDKMLLFPEKIATVIKEKYDVSYPVSVELSLTNSCNLKCEWCSDSKLRKDRPGSLGLNTYMKLVDDLSENGTRGLVIEGGGEPTTYPQFKKTLNYALDKKLAVGLITNGVKFNYSEYVSKLEWIRVSLDADTPENFRKWKGKDCFYKVLDNIKAMCKVNKGRCTIGVGYVVTRYNIKHLEEITLLLSDCGVNYFYLRPVIDNPDMLIRENLYYLKKYESRDFSVMIHAMDENAIKGNMKLPCSAHSLSCVISGNGDVFICGRLNIYDWVNPLGNLNGKTFDEIWHGEERKKQIKMVQDGAFCSKWCPECRMTKFNNIFHRTCKIKTRNFI